jgi:hypothetical protein
MIGTNPVNLEFTQSDEHPITDQVSKGLIPDGHYATHSPQSSVPVSKRSALLIPVCRAGLSAMEGLALLSGMNSPASIAFYKQLGQRVSGVLKGERKALPKHGYALGIVSPIASVRCTATFIQLDRKSGARFGTVDRCSREN